MSNLSVVRKQLGLSQRAVADAAGISAVYYQKLECGKQVPTVEIAQRIARVLGSSVGDLWPVQEET